MLTSKQGVIRHEPYERLDTDAIRRDHPLPAVAGAVVKLVRAGSEWKACCPFHADKTPSFTIYAGSDRFQCFGCGAGGDVLAFVQRHYGVGLRQAAEMLCGGDLPTVGVEPTVWHNRDVRDDSARSAEALAIWEASSPAEGTLAESYLRSRGVHLTIPTSVRFARLCYGSRGPEHPVLVAAVNDVGGALIGIQRTYLNPVGTGKAAVPKPKLSLGKIRGGAIRLAPAGPRLVVCEGLEDGLSLQQETGHPVWVSAGLSNLAGMMFPTKVRSVAVGGDADERGRAGAQDAAETYALRGLEARTFFPEHGKDFNQQLIERTRA